MKAVCFNLWLKTKESYVGKGKVKNMEILGFDGSLHVFVFATAFWAVVCLKLLGDNELSVLLCAVLSIGSTKLWSVFGWLTVAVPLLFTGLVFVGFLVVRLHKNRTQFRPIGENSLGRDGAGIGGPQRGVPVPSNPRLRR